MMPKTVIRLH